MKIKVVGINARYTHSSLALFYLRNELEAAIESCSVEICQYTINDPYYILVQRLASGNPDYIFISALIWNSDLVENLVADLHMINDDCHYVIGGPQARVVGRKFEDSDRVTIFHGDIEAAGETFFDDIKKRKPHHYYEASFFRAGVDQLDYPYRPEDFSTALKNRHIYYETSRGCPFSCTYCLSSAENGVFHKDLNQVFQELDDILSYSPSVVRFLDRTFNDNRDRALEIWKYLKEYGGQTLFHFEIAPEQFNDEMLSFLKTVEPGCFQFEIGIQSTNSATLKAIKRHMNADNAAEVIRTLRSMENIHLHADLILGLPDETFNSFCASFNDVFSMRPHYIQMGLLKLLPDTAITAQAEEYGYRGSLVPPYSVFANSWLSSDELRKLHWVGECVEKCINNRFFVSLWRYFSDISENMADFFLDLSAVFLAEGYFWKAATQEALSRLLLSHMEGRQDRKVIKELLCYDWLRCGHRFLPDHLHCGSITLDELRRKLFQELPKEVPGQFDEATRKTFFKKGVFYVFSRETLDHIGYEVNAPQAVLRFSADREKNVNRLNHVCIIKEIK